MPRLSKKEYLLYSAIGIGVLALIVFYVLEIYYINRTFKVGWLMGISALVGLAAGGWIAYNLRQTGKDLTEKIELYVFCMLMGAFFAPLLGSLSNRLLSFHPVRQEAVEFVKQEGYKSDRFGILQGEEVELDGYYLFFLRHGKVERITTKIPLPPDIQRGDTLYLPTKKGLWGFEWITR